MKNIYKNVVLTLTLILAANISFAQKGELLITVQNAGNNIDIVFELLSESNVAGLQFDVKIPSMQASKMAVSACTSGVKSNLAGCSLNGNVLRVGIINQGLKDMKSGEVGRVTLKNANGLLDAKLFVSNAKLVDKKGQEVNINAVVDYNKIEIRKEKLDLEFRK